MENKKFRTNIVNLETLQNYHFSIPTYQRPYVWKDEQLKKMLDDFYKSFELNEKEYFIGTFLTKEEGFEAELIDGQQRFTTLWLISFVLNTIEPRSLLSNFLKIDKRLRLGFEIRNEVVDYLHFLLDDKIEFNKKYDEATILNFPYLENIASGLTFIKGYFDSLKGRNIDLFNFGNFIYKNIYLIKNTTPEKTDLNKLFSTINSSGVQLEQTDIVKANLLSSIDDKLLYSKIWESCEDMNTFFERSVRSSFPKSDFNKIDFRNFVEFDSNIFCYDLSMNEEDNKESFFIDTLSLDSIIPYSETQRINEDEVKEPEEIHCRSIINFGQLLLHTYRLHLKIEGKNDFEGTFHVNRLIEIFKTLENTEDNDEIKRFFKLLWKVRFLFDKYIVKWITDLDTKSETLELVRLNRSENSYYPRSRYENKTAMLMLQSVLYFTGDYLRQYWLTSYLGFLLENHNNSLANDDSLLDKLEKLDNLFSLNSTLTDKEASFILIDNEISTNFNIEKYLVENNGVKFQHYWFQKLEYILWKNWDEEKTNEFNNFRIMSKNSVEHIYPQNPENPLKSPNLKDGILHSFGNLVLLSVSQNSEYSRKSYDEKKGMFNYKNTYDTLKSYFIFKKYNDWRESEIIEHRDLMISKIVNHYKINE